MRHLLPLPLRGGVGVLLIAALLVAPDRAGAVEYPDPIVVDDDDGIYQAYENGLVTETERDRLIDLMRERVDLNRADRDELYELPGMSYLWADRILKYRKKHGDFTLPEDVLEVPGLPDELWEQMAAFVDAGKGWGWMKDVRGRFRLRGNAIDTYNPGDTAGTVQNPEDPPPAFAQQADFTILDNYTLGWTLLLDEHLAPVRFEPWAGDEPGYFVTDGKTYVPGLSSFKAYGTGRWGKFDVIVGHYRAGFGQGLTFDTTGKIQPWGWVRDQTVYEAYNGVGFSMSRGQRGAAVTARELELGDDLTLDASAFFSFSDDSAYQYDFGYFQSDTRNPDDPPEFASYRVYEGFAADENKLSYQTLPRVFHEMLGGGALRLQWGERHYLGVAGYGSRVLWRLGDEFRFSDSASYPEDRQTWGVFGAHFGTGVGAWSLFGEAALTDSLAPAVYARSLFELDVVDVDLSVRDYEPDFDNPHSRGKADEDEHLGDRDRDERGARVLVTGKLPWKVRLSGALDVWQRPSLDLWNGEIYGRVDWNPWRWMGLAAWLTLKDKDLTSGGRDQSYDTPSSGVARGMKWDWTVQATSQPLDGLVFTAYYKRTLKDDSTYVDAFEPTQSFWVRGAYRFLTDYRVAARLKFYDEDTLDAGRGDRYWEVYGEAEARLWKSLYAKLRYTWQRGSRLVVDTDEAGHEIAIADLPSFHQVKGALEVTF